MNWPTVLTWYGTSGQLQSDGVTIELTVAPHVPGIVRIDHVEYMPDDPLVSPSIKPVGHATRPLTAHECTAIDAWLHRIARSVRARMLAPLWTGVERRQEWGDG